MKTNVAPRMSRQSDPTPPMSGNVIPEMTLLMYSNRSAPKSGPTSVPTPPTTFMMTKSPEVIQYSAVFGWMYASWMENSAPAIPAKWPLMTNAISL